MIRKKLGKNILVIASVFSLAFSPIAYAETTAAATEAASEEESTDVSDEAIPESSETAEGEAASEMTDETMSELPESVGETTESTEEISVEETAEGPKEAPKTTNEKTRWIPTSESDTVRTVDLTDLVTGINKLEIFYAPNSAGAPDVTFTSSMGHTYTAGPDSVDSDDFVFMRKEGKSLAPTYKTVSFYTVYITQNEGETWRMTLSRSAGLDFFIVITATAPDNFRNISTDYRTRPLKQILWMDKSSGSTYVPFVKNFIAEDTDVPEESEPEPTEPEKKSPVGTILFFGGLMFLIFAGLVFFLLTKQNKAREKRELDLEKQRIAAANGRVQERMRRENENLGAYLDSYDEEYERADAEAGDDDEYYDDYPAYGNENDSIPETVPRRPDEIDQEDEPEEEHGKPERTESRQKRDDDIARDEEPVARTVPAKTVKTQSAERKPAAVKKQPPAAKKPSGTTKKKQKVYVQVVSAQKKSGSDDEIPEWAK